MPYRVVYLSANPENCTLSLCDQEPPRPLINMQNIALFSASALDAALEFQQQFVVPSTWKTEVKEESSSSEDDDDDEEEEQEEDASGEEEEVEKQKLACLHHNLEAKRRFSIYIFFLLFFLSKGGSGAVPRGAGELSAAAVQVHGRQR